MYKFYSIFMRIFIFIMFQKSLKFQTTQPLQQALALCGSHLSHHIAHRHAWRECLELVVRPHRHQMILWSTDCSQVQPHSIGGRLCVALHVSCSKYTGSAHPGFNRYKGAPQYSGKTTSPLHFWQLDSLVKTTEHEFEYYRQEENGRMVPHFSALLECLLHTFQND